MLHLAICCTALLPQPGPQKPMSRSAVLRSAAALGISSATASLLQPPLPAAAISATTMSGKSKPELGCILQEEPQPIGKSGISANLVLASGLASVSFSSPWKVAEGNYYDVATKSQDGDAAFVQVVDAGGKSLSSLPKNFFSKSVLSLDGFYGAYGEPIDAVFKDGTPSSANGANGAAARVFECTFTPLGPSGDGSPRKGVVTAIQPSGSKDIVMLVASTSATRWKKAKGETDCRTAAESFTVRMSPTALKAVPNSDYRFGKASGPSNMKSRNDGF